MKKIIPQHIPVLLNEVLEYAMPENGKIFADCTFGLGGHSTAILRKYPEIETLIAIDKDEEILEHTCDTISDTRIKRFQANASDLPGVLSFNNISGVDGILVDLGVSSYQLDNDARGFSFMKEGPLDMRMDKSISITAEDLVNTWSSEDLCKIFRSFGEEKFAKKIADKICYERNSTPIKTTVALANLVSDCYPHAIKRKSKIHPATKVFQALRIEVNEELKELSLFLENSLKCLNPGGHLSVISFHSLEDRITKNFFVENANPCVCPPNFPVCNCGKKPTLEILTKKPVIATEKEIAGNPRSRSAKLRCAKRILEKE